MRTWNSLKTSGAVLIATLLVAAQAQAIVAYNNPNPTINNPSGLVSGNGNPSSYGNIFQVLTPINITAIGAFDSANNGFTAGAAQVAIYQLTSGTLSSSPVFTEIGATAKTFNQAVGSYSYVGLNAFQSLSSPQVLTAGTYAIVAANFGQAANPAGVNNVAGTYLSSTIDNDPYIARTATYNGFTKQGTVQNTLQPFYTTGATGTGNNIQMKNFGVGFEAAFAAGSFEFTPVPEAAHFAMAGVGLLGLVYIGRYARMRRTVKFA